MVLDVSVYIQSKKTYRLPIFQNKILSAAIIFVIAVAFNLICFVWNMSNAEVF